MDPETVNASAPGAASPGPANNGRPRLLRRWLSALPWLVLVGLVGMTVYTGWRTAALLSELSTDPLAIRIERQQHLVELIASAVDLLAAIQLPPAAGAGSDESVLASLDHLSARLALLPAAGRALDQRLVDQFDRLRRALQAEAGVGAGRLVPEHELRAFTASLCELGQTLGLEIRAGHEQRQQRLGELRRVLLIDLGLLAGAIALLVVGVLRGRRKEAQLQAQKRLLDEAVDAMPDGFAVFDPQDRLQSFNASYRRMFFAADPDFVRAGRRFDELLAAGPAGWDGDGSLAELDRALRLHRAGGSLETRFADGRRILTRARRLEDGRLLCLYADVGAARDMEEELALHRSRLEELVRQKTVQLEGALHELESLSYTISHDLRSPLRAVDGFASLLLEDYGEILDRRGRHHLNRLRRAAQQMGRLIDDLLSLTRIFSQKFEPEQVDLSALAGQVIEALREHSPERSVEVEIEPGMVANGDPALLAVLLEKLLGNAWHYSAERQPARIRFLCRQLDGERVYEVADNGIGFDMAYYEQLFETFRRLHDDAQPAGSGIGLATAARIVRRHRGRIWAEGEPGRGARFFFTLGAADGESAAARVSSPANPKSPR